MHRPRSFNVIPVHQLILKSKSSKRMSWWHLAELDFPQPACRGGRLTLQSCPRLFSRECRQYDSVDVKRRAALWNSAVNPVSINWCVQWRVSGRHFKKTIVGLGHLAEWHERHLSEVGLENPKAAGGEHQIRVLQRLYKHRPQCAVLVPHSVPEVRYSLQVHDDHQRG